MQLSVTFRHMEPSEAIKQYAAEKVEKIRKFIPEPIRAQVVFSSERHLHQVDVLITLHNGIALKGKETTDNVFSAIDLVTDKIERQVRKYKTRIQNHRPVPGPVLPVQHEVHEPDGADDVAATEPAEERRVIRRSHFDAKPMSTEDAIMQLELLHTAFLVFVDAATHSVNVVYKRDDGYGLIETKQAAGEPG
ncbi:MAG: ribosome-associated translation inhibitor RaiA [Deltaproteobacteria bacterium]|nr:ribosome-associated translation inhibitor RaiA [Deltaproteobacteria bacterium]